MNEVTRVTVFEELEGMVREAEVVLGDGFQFGDVFDLIHVLTRGVETIATKIEVGDKRQLVLDAFDYLDDKFGVRTRAIEKLDAVPMVPTWLAKKIFDRMLAHFVDGIVKVLNKEGIFEHKGAAPAAGKSAEVEG